MISPTGLGIRSDSMGDGHFGSRRDNGRRIHKGTDYLCRPGQSVYSPIDGLVVREAWPYADGQYSGVLIENRQVAVKLFYLLPDPSTLDNDVRAGDVIGTAQDISRRYGRRMRPRVMVKSCVWRNLGGDPFFFYSIHKFDSPYYFCQAFRMM